MSSFLEEILRRDRLIIIVSLFLITGLAWAYLVFLSAGMMVTDSMSMMMIRPWSVVDFILMFLMWAIMMIAMMIPSAAPMILFFNTYNHKMRSQGNQFVNTFIFVSGYIVVWSAFSLIATFLQWQLEQASLLSPMMVSSSPMLGGFILILGGVYQWTPIKRTCIRHCRTPVQFISGHWRKGPRGALIMGIIHGMFCLGCCWVLMALLFLGGVMNLLWIAAISFFVLLEKVMPFGDKMGRLSGIILIIAGVFLVAQLAVQN